jgi:perosamine synthetase
MLRKIDIPPTAGLAMQGRDFLPAASRLDTALAQQLNIPQPVLTCSGTAAQIVTLKAMAATSLRKTVIIPAYTCPLVALAIVHCGLKIQLCDVAAEHFDFDFAQLQQLANHDTLAIISTHLGGRVADVAQCLSIARQVGAYVIEDAAQALGAQWQGQSVGLLGDAAFFSLAVGKGLTTFEGGVLFAKDATWQQALQQYSLALLRPKIGWELRRSVELSAYFAAYRPRLLPYAYGNSYRQSIAQNDWLSALGDDFSLDIPLHTLGAWRQARAWHALQRLPAFLQHTRAQALKRVQALQSAGLKVINDTTDAQGVWPFLMVVMPSTQRRDQALQQLTPLGLGVSRLFMQALNDYDYLQTTLKPHYAQTLATSHARDFAGRMLTISNSPWLSDAQFARVVDILGENSR